MSISTTLKGSNAISRGGYHLIEIGDHLHTRYRVVHKLGYGTFSTTWLAQDKTLSKYVAVKVGTADSGQKEVDILTRLYNPTLQDGNRGKELILPMLDRFSVYGPNGTHPCFVTAPARCNLADTKEASNSRLFQLPVARSLAAQLAIAVAYTHRRGLVHGDLHLGNILLRLSSTLDQLSEKQLYDQFDPPDPEPVRRADGKPLASGVPHHVFSPVWLGDASEKITLSESKLLLTDFGTAFYPAQESRLQSYTPLEIRPPEARFEPTTPLSFASDIWSLACTIWAIIGQRSFLDSFLLSQDDATSDQVDALGRLPPEWWEKWEARSKSFTEDGRPKGDRSPWSWDQRFEDSIQQPRREKGMETLDEKESHALCEMIRWMLAFRPGDRPSADQVLKTAWMRNWAIPESEKTWK
ncbi:kinase-like domain-containing protein [Ilyonectria destructans]|nr:kinase-like domain-containing protein [Ilyonectria destructans]